MKVGVGGGCVGKILVGVAAIIGVVVRVEVVVRVAVVVRLGSDVTDGYTVGTFFCPPQAVRIMQIITNVKNVFFISLLCKDLSNYVLYTYCCKTLIGYLIQ